MPKKIFPPPSNFGLATPLCLITSIKGARKFLRQVRDCQTPKNAAGRQICFYT